MIKPAAFLDRDGTINIDKGYVFKSEDFEWIFEAPEAIKFLNENGYHVFIVTNQSGISRGFYSEKDVESLHDFINRELNKKSAHIDDFFYSPFHPDFSIKKYENYSHFRKPNTGMIEYAFNNWPIERGRSFLVGDKHIDVKCAENFGIKGYLYESGSLMNFIKEIVNKQ